MNLYSSNEREESTFFFVQFVCKFVYLKDSFYRQKSDDSPNKMEYTHSVRRLCWNSILNEKKRSVPRFREATYLIKCSEKWRSNSKFYYKAKATVLKFSLFSSSSVKKARDSCILRFVRYQRCFEGDTSLTLLVKCVCVSAMSERSVGIRNSSSRSLSKAKKEITNDEDE